MASKLLLALLLCSTAYAEDGGIVTMPGDDRMLDHCLREEAKRLGIKPCELSALEHGRKT